MRPNLFWIQSVLIVSVHLCHKPHRTPLVVLVFDGLRHDFIRFLKYKNDSQLRELMENGSYVRLKSVFPTESFPNLHSIVTGKLPGIHGIVSDTMYDLSSIFSSSREDSWNTNWYSESRRFEPIWFTNERRVGHTSACVGYPGCCVTPRSKTPVAYCSPSCFVGNAKNAFKEILSLLLDGHEFIIGHIEQMAATFRLNGTGNYQVMQEMGELDRELRNLVTVMKRLGYWNRLNLLILGTTGIMNYNFQTKPIVISDHVKLDGFRVLGRGPSIKIFKNALRPNWTLLNQLHKIHHVTTLRDKEMKHLLGPITDRSRVPVAWLIADPTYRIYSNPYERRRNMYAANNGYMPKFRYMMPLLIAYGPDIKAIGGMKQTLLITEVNHLMKQLLGLPCRNRTRRIYRMLQSQ
ncbi:hypothetical protein ACOME3_004541 [Neoechinorhynchus agilis]